MPDAHHAVARVVKRRHPGGSNGDRLQASEIALEPYRAAELLDVPLQKLAVAVRLMLHQIRERVDLLMQGVVVSGAAQTAVT